MIRQTTAAVLIAALLQNPALAAETTELLAAAAPAETGSAVPALEFDSFQGQLLQIHEQRGGGQHGGGGQRGGGGGGWHPAPQRPQPRPEPRRPEPRPQPRPEPRRPEPRRPEPRRPEPRPEPRRPEPRPEPRRPEPRPEPRRPEPRPEPRRPDPRPEPRRPLPGRPGNGGFPTPRPTQPRPLPPVGRPSGGRPERLPQRPQPVGRGIGRDTRPVEAPRAGPGGRVIHERPLENGHGRIIAPRAEHRGIMERDWREHRGEINRYHERERDGGYYWHRWGDHDVCHRYWGGYHWWGWYVGPVFFWSAWYNDYYWWYDPYWHRWCWLHDGRWWWHENDVVYIYVDETNTYSRYDDGVGGVVTVPDTTPPVDAPPPSDAPAPAPDANTRTFNSADGTRMVTVTDTADAKGRAYLYAADDQAADQALKDGVWLGDNVSDVRFQNDADGKLSRILTLFADEQGQQSFNLFDVEGNNLSSPTVAPAPAQPIEDTDNPPNVTDPSDSGVRRSPSFQQLERW